MYSENIWQLKGTTKWVLELRTQNPDGTWTKTQSRHPSKKAAKQAAVEKRNQSTQKRKNNQKTKLESLIKPYAEHKANYLRQGTVGAYLHLITLYVLPEFGKRNPSEITKQELTTWMQQLAKRGLTKSTINTIRARFLDLLKYAKGQELIDTNPLEGIPPFRAQTNQTTQVCQPWNIDEAKAALAAFAGTELHLFIALALGTGMRKGEILALRWDDFDLSKGTVKVNKSRGEKRIYEPDGSFKTITIETPPKTAASNRTLELNSIILDAIANDAGSKQHDEYAITGKNGHAMSPGHLDKRFKKICQQNNLRHIRIHDLRHTAAVIGLTNGAALEELSQGLGHSGIEITKRIYAPIVPVLAARFTAKIGEALRH